MQSIRKIMLTKEINKIIDKIWDISKSEYQNQLEKLKEEIKKANIKSIKEVKNFLNGFKSSKLTTLTFNEVIEACIIILKSPDKERAEIVSEYLLSWIPNERENKIIVSHNDDESEIDLFYAACKVAYKIVTLESSTFQYDTFISSIIPIINDEKNHRRKRKSHPKYLLTLLSIKSQEDLELIKKEYKWNERCTIYDNYTLYKLADTDEKTYEVMIRFYKKLYYNLRFIKHGEYVLPSNIIIIFDEMIDTIAKASSYENANICYEILKLLSNKLYMIRQNKKYYFRGDESDIEK